MTSDGNKYQTRNVRITNLVSMLTRGDGINFHGEVYDSVVEDCHIANTGDDIYAMWGAYANPTGNVFKNSIGKNPGVTRNYKYGVCVAVYGAKGVTFTGITCYDTDESHGENSNSALAYVHGNWFGAVYPRDNIITIEDNKYLYMASSKPIVDRPMLKNNAGSANVITGPTPAPTPFTCSSKPWGSCKPSSWTGSCLDHLKYSVEKERKSCDVALEEIKNQCQECNLCSTADCGPDFQAPNNLFFLGKSPSPSP
jgi:hypothetical protein